MESGYKKRTCSFILTSEDGYINKKEITEGVIGYLTILLESFPLQN